MAVQIYIILTCKHKSKDMDGHADSWQGLWLTYGHYSINVWCIASFTTNLKLENWLLVWTEAREVQLHWRVELETILETVNFDLRDLEAIIECLSIDTERCEQWWL